MCQLGCLSNHMWVTAFLVCAKIGASVWLSSSDRSIKGMKAQKVYLPQPILNLEETLPLPAQANLRQSSKRQSHLGA